MQILVDSVSQIMGSSFIPVMSGLSEKSECSPHILILPFTSYSSSLNTHILMTLWESQENLGLFLCVWKFFT